jgi:hypothetical protein
MTTAAVVLAAVATLHPRMPKPQARAIAAGIAGEPSCRQLDPLLVVAVADVESSLDPAKVNVRTGAAGRRAHGHRRQPAHRVRGARAAVRAVSVG